MRRRNIESELAYVENCLNDIADRESMRATTSGINQLKELAFRICCCRAALDIMEGSKLHPITALICDYCSGVMRDITLTSEPYCFNLCPMCGRELSAV